MADDDLPTVLSTAQRPVAGGFVKGFDPRRAPGGMPKEFREARDALAKHLPRAVELFGQLLESSDERVQLLAASEIADRTIGKPKAMDTETSESVREELKIVFSKLREMLDEATYKLIIKSIAEGEK